MNDRESQNCPRLGYEPWSPGYCSLLPLRRIQRNQILHARKQGPHTDLGRAGIFIDTGRRLSRFCVLDILCEQVEEKTCNRMLCVPSQIEETRGALQGSESTVRRKLDSIIGVRQPPPGARQFQRCACCFFGGSPRTLRTAGFRQRCAIDVWEGTTFSFALRSLPGVQGPPGPRGQTTLNPSRSGRLTSK